MLEEVEAGIAFGISVGIAVLRGYYYLIDYGSSGGYYKGRWYRFHPVAWDDVCSLPVPGLHRLLVAYAELAPAAGNAEIERLISSYPSQRMQALRARTTLIARGGWPGSQTSPASMRRRRASRKATRTFLRQTPEVRRMVGGIAALQRRLDAIDRPVLREPCATPGQGDREFPRPRRGFREPLASEFRERREWLLVAKRQLTEVQMSRQGAHPATVPRRRSGRSGAGGLRPPYGRARQLERQVMLATAARPVIYGRRRMGKSTLLRNLDGFCRLLSGSSQSRCRTRPPLRPSPLWTSPDLG